jgi:hypothetical protein
MQKGSAGSVDGSRVVAIERQDITRFAGRVTEIDMRQSFPSTTNANHFTTNFRAPIDHRLYDRVQSGYVAASREYAYALLCHV